MDERFKRTIIALFVIILMAVACFIISSVARDAVMKVAMKAAGLLLILMALIDFVKTIVNQI